MTGVILRDRDRVFNTFSLYLLTEPKFDIDIFSSFRTDPKNLDWLCFCLCFCLCLRIFFVFGRILRLRPLPGLQDKTYSRLVGGAELQSPLSSPLPDSVTFQDIKNKPLGDISR